MALGMKVARAQQPTRLYIANDEHTDYKWTGNEAQYDSAFVHMLDYYLDQIDSTKNNPDDFQARFNCDGSFWLYTYEKYRSPAQFNRLVSAIESGHISSPLNTLVSTYGAQPTEAVLRGMYYAGQMERRLGLRFPMAVCMENQTLPLGLSSLWAGSGAKYSWRGVCGCASRLSNTSLAHRQHQLYRYMGQDQTGVLMKWYNLSTDNKSLGGYAETRLVNELHQATESIAQTVERLSNLCYTTAYPYHIAGAFGYGWDDLATFVSPAFVQAAQQTTTTDRKVRVSNEEDFFKDIVRSYPDLPTESLSYGNEWDTYSASMNETTALVRRATEKLRSAEALASLVSLQNKSFGKNLIELRQKAWEGFGLYWEHDWTADGPVSAQDRGNWQKKMQEQISTYVDTLYQLSSKSLGQQLKKSTNPRFYVFNPLSWERDDVADIEYDGNYPVAVLDVSSGQLCASQLITKEGKRFLRIMARKIPSVGYKVFELSEGSSKKLPVAATLSDGFFKNALYRLRIHPSGVISQLYDSLAQSRQLIKIQDGKYLNDLGTLKLDDGEPLVIENEGPVSVTLKGTSSLPVLHSFRITLFKDIPRIEIQNSIEENFKDIKTWAFSFDLINQTTSHEELGAVLTAKIQTRGGDYSAQNARYDWLTFNHFADLSEENYGVTLSNLDCSFFKLGASTPDSLWEQSAQLYALAGGQTDGEKLGIPAQHGQSRFNYHFALTTHAQAFDATAAMKFSLEHQNPLMAQWITGTIGRSPNEFSLLSVTDPDLLLWSVKPSEEGIEKGLITRFWNLANQPKTPAFRLNLSVRNVRQTTHLETDELQLTTTKSPFTAIFNPYQLRTFRWIIR
ncbi:glycoside hydrolase [Arundinibacter roseus]|uniref:Glycoside hydrolase n=2 Tax=Arundinibacter roseus TaxID=2070510 RepID=A0A4R4KHH6_9BACT|nr:glycoside hydrolase [Arundinibacter roseus]